jgi:putative transposase
MAVRRRLSTQDHGAPGWWFITCVCADRSSLLGEVHADGAVVTSQIGDLVCGAWSAITRVRPWIVLDRFVVMPDHVHGLLRVGDAPPGSAVPLSVVVNGFKGAVTRLARDHQLITRSTTLWQRSFDARPLPNDNSVARARRYIVENPLRAASAMPVLGTPTNPAAAQRAADCPDRIVRNAVVPAAAQRAADCPDRIVRNAVVPAAAHRAADCPDSIARNAVVPAAAYRAADCPNATAADCPDSIVRNAVVPAAAYRAADCPNATAADCPDSIARNAVVPAAAYRAADCPNATAADRSDSIVRNAVAPAAAQRAADSR